VKKVEREGRWKKKEDGEKGSRQNYD